MAQSKLVDEARTKDIIRKKRAKAKVSRPTSSPPGTKVKRRGER